MKKYQKVGKNVVLKANEKVTFVFSWYSFFAVY